MALVILGLGNDLLADDGIGLIAADAIERMGLGGSVAVRKSGQSGLYLLEPLQGFEDAILIDSVLGDVPGRVRELAAIDVRPAVVPSAHYAGLPEALALARASGLPMPRRIRIFAVEIEAAQTIGGAPRAEVAAALEPLVDRVVAAAREWGYA